MLKLLTVLTLLSSTRLLAQDVVQRYPIKLKASTVAMGIDAGDKAALIFMDHKSINMWLMDQDYQKVDSLIFDRLTPSDKHQKLLGGIYKENTLILYFTSHDNVGFGSAHIDLKTKKVSWLYINLSLQDQFVMGAIIVNNTFYVTSIMKASNRLKFYEFDDSHNYRETEITVKDTPGYKHLYKAIKGIHLAWTGGSGPIVRHINPNGLNALTATSFQSKLYTFNDKFILTYDREGIGTSIYQFDLEASEVSEWHLEFKKACELKASNSLIYENTLYQTLACDDNLHLKMHDLNTRKELSSFTVAHNEPIPFSNTPLYSERFAFESLPNASKTKLKRTGALLRRMKSGAAAIAAEDHNEETVELTVGGVNITRGIGYFKSLWDKDSHKHVKGEVKHSFLQKWYLFKKKYPNRSATLLWRTPDAYYYSFYHIEAREYILTRFPFD